mmetsp:Transcript_14072/g.30568  ORF Transcript_14072/g.30568 Transcript_14072/m.30568 type:complete len:389 (-) Transcript_14072:53-1219(-)
MEHLSASFPAHDGQLTRSDELRAVVDCFQPGIVHAVGYGSGVFVQQQEPGRQQQQQQQTSFLSRHVGLKESSSVVSTDPEGASASNEPMIDLLLTVSDCASFHEQTLQRYPNHYSALARLCGPKFCTTLQRSERYGAGVYFNPLVDSPVAGNSTQRKRKIKYGVIQLEDLICDLTTWKWLYVAGRMHKPTVTVEGLEQCDHVATAQKQNLDMALAASLLLLGSDTAHMANENKTYELTTLYERIAGLSYVGDPRMDVGGEDPHKVSKLVRSDGQEDRFYSMYRDSMSDLAKLGVITFDRSNIQIDLHDNATRRKLWKALPQRVNKGTCYGVGIEQPETSADYLSKCLVNIVRPAARRQSIKGLLTAGLVRSFQYAGAKFAKGAFRKLR